MSERTIRLLLAIGFAALDACGLAELYYDLCEGMPLNGAFWWFVIFLFGLGFTAVCLLRPAASRPTPLSDAATPYKQK